MTRGNAGLGSWIERRARTGGDRLALASGSVRHTYAELAERIRRLAHGLRVLGVGHGDRVGYLGANHPAFLEGLFAAGQLGAILAPINHRLDAAGVESICVDAAPRVVLADSALEGTRLPAVVRHVVTFGEPGDGGCELERLIAESTATPLDEAVGLDDVCMLPYTSGTTGPPKGIMLTHGNLSWNVFNMVSSGEIRGDDVTLAIAPFFRTGGTGVNVLPVLWMGGTVVVPRHMNSDEILRLVEAHRATIGFGNPDLLEQLTASARWESTDLSSLRIFFTGGAPVYERLLEAYAARGVTFLQGYGLSEAAPVVSLLDPESAAHKVGSAGRPPLHVEVRVVRPDGTTCTSDETGELLIRGPNVMAGYWNAPEATARVLSEDGWLRSGDAVRADAGGFLYVVGRIADAYTRDGEVIHPGRAEHVLLTHPRVAEACVVGNQEQATAFIVPTEGPPLTETVLLAFAREHLPAAAQPTDIRLVDALPRNPGGKIMRHLLPLTAE